MKNKINWAIGIFIFLVIGYYLISHDYFFHEKFVQGGEKIDGQIQAVKNTINTEICPEGIIPEKVALWEAEGMAGIVESLEYRNKIISNWQDGISLYVARDQNSPMTPYYNYYGSDCRKGNIEGENINHLYCEGLVYNNSQTKVNSEGVIGKTSVKSYLINLELVSIEDEEWFIRGEYDVNRVKIYGNYSVVSSKCIKNN